MKILTGHSNRVFTLAALSNSQLVSGSADYTIKVWDVSGLMEYEGWEMICEMNSCQLILEECTNKGCLGKEGCKSCVESYQTTCLSCVLQIYDQTALVTLENDESTIVCDANNQLHKTVCNFYCRGLNKVYYKCETKEDQQICSCFGPSIIHFF